MLESILPVCKMKMLSFPLYCYYYVYLCIFNFFNNPLLFIFSVIVCTTQFLNDDNVNVRYKLNVHVHSTTNMLIIGLDV